MLSLTQRLVAALGALALVTAVGTIGLVIVEGFTPGDALYFTIVTLTTVGYGDLVPRTGLGRVFTVGLILSGVGTALYLFSITAQIVLEGHLRDLFGRNAMHRRTEHLQGHVIVCGYGRFGRVVADELRRNGAEVVVIDADPIREDELKVLGVSYLIGSAVSDEILEQAGVRRAKAIVVATPSDPDNVFITLSAREKNAAIRIHARGETEAGLRRLELAGANQALSAYHSGGLRMAASILRPSVVDFIELSLPGHHGEIVFEEVRVGRGCALLRQTIADVERDCPRLRVVALKRENDAIRVVPDASLRLEPEDLLVVIGERDGLARLALAAAGATG